MDDRRITIALELRLAGDSLTGRATDDTGANRSFSGWLGLVTALDGLVSAASSSAPTNLDREAPDDDR